MLKLGIVLLFLLIFLCPLSSQAQDICFDDATAARMVVALEQAKISEQQLTVQASGNIELQAQVDILKGTIKLMQDQIDLYKASIETYKSLVAMNQSLSDAKDKAFKEELKQAQPTFMDKVKTNTTWTVFGVVIGFALKALLLF